MHGTAIGVARSSDGGRNWQYQGTLDGLVPPGTELPATLGAPDVIRIGDQWIMYLTVLGGVRTDWTGTASIVQLASRDLVTWEHLGPIDLDSPRVIDAAVAPCGDGRHRLWYKDEEYLDGLILTAPEPADGGPVVGRHADVVPLEATADGKERALILYFTHPHWNGEDIDGMTADPKSHLSHIRAAVLEVHNGDLVCIDA